MNGDRFLSSPCFNIGWVGFFTPWGYLRSNVGIYSSSLPDRECGIFTGFWFLLCILSVVEKTEWPPINVFNWDHKNNRLSCVICKFWFFSVGMSLIKALNYLYSGSFSSYFTTCGFTGYQFFPKHFGYQKRLKNIPHVVWNGFELQK